MKIYGEPSHVYAIVGHPHTVQSDGKFVNSYSLELVYLLQGFKVSVTTEDGKLILSSETLFDRVTFFLTRDVKVLNPPDLYKPWQGFTGYNSYCFDIYQVGEEPCKNQS